MTQNDDFPKTDCTDFDYAVAIGRFQPVHNGHVALLQACLRLADRVIVVAGSAQQARTVKNPFTVRERAGMLLSALPGPAWRRVRVLGVDDVPGDDAAWLAAVEAAVDAAMRADGVEPAAMRVALVGHMKDGSSYYLEIFPRWQWQPFANVDGIDATAVRASYFAGPEALDAHAALWRQPGIVPPSTTEFLQQFRATPQWDLLRQAWRRHRAGIAGTKQAAKGSCAK